MAGYCWKDDLFHIHFNDENEFVTVVETVLMLGQPYKVIPLVTVWKEEGNLSFKKGMFDIAMEQYEKAAKHLSCTLLVSMMDDDKYKDLAVSLHLNLAACALKLGDFRQAFDLCSFVLIINPHCVKAQFRRAKAAMEVGLAKKAFEDLTRAANLDPSNKEIQKELGKVVLIIKSITNGKRKHDGLDISEGRKCGDQSRGRTMDALCVAQGSENLVEKSIPLRYSTNPIVIDEVSSVDVTGVPSRGYESFLNLSSKVPCQESSATDAHTNRAAAPLSNVFIGCPMEVEATLDEAYSTSSNVVSEENNFSALKHDLSEQMYRFTNR